MKPCAWQFLRGAEQATCGRRNPQIEPPVKARRLNIDSLGSRYPQPDDRHRTAAVPTSASGSCL